MIFTLNRDCFFLMISQRKIGSIPFNASFLLRVHNLVHNRALIWLPSSSRRQEAVLSEGWGHITCSLLPRSVSSVPSVGNHVVCQRPGVQFNWIKCNIRALDVSLNLQNHGFLLAGWGVLSVRMDFDRLQRRLSGLCCRRVSTSRQQLPDPQCRGSGDGGYSRLLPCHTARAPCHNS